MREWTIYKASDYKYSKTIVLNEGATFAEVSKYLQLVYQYDCFIIDFHDNRITVYDDYVE